MTFRKYLILSLIILIGCNSEPKQKNSLSSQAEEINIRINRDPQYVNPFFSPSSIGREIYQYVYLSLADYHPESLQLHPILITEIPTGTLTNYNDEEVIAYDINIRPEAAWSDSTPVTADDYIYTIMAINHTQSKISAWKPYFKFLKGYKTYENNPKNYACSHF